MALNDTILAAAAGLFLYSFFWMSIRLWQFLNYDRTFGATPRISLDELVALSDETGRDLPAFVVIVPAFKEALTIEATMRRIANANYPASLLDLVVVTYCDEPPALDGVTTHAVASRFAQRINAEVGRERIRVEHVPAGFDGFFPGEFDTGKRHVGKARGLNYAIRRLHERNVADEARFTAGRALECGLSRPEADPALPDFLREAAAAPVGMSDEDLREHARARIAELEATRPLLASRIAEARDAATVAGMATGMNPRWAAIYDADADAPPDLFRHLAARILSEPEAMGFQGPVAPLANFDEVHPLCGMAALWIAFSHATSFPRLMTRPHWARPLAGTNWCMRIDGYSRDDGRLVPNPPEPGAQPVRFLSFDPRQLTEDLEAALRFYADWRVVADWHPHLEWEQAAPTPRDLVGQWTRWTLGTLQAMRAMLGANLPWRQKLWMAGVPFQIAATGLGPAITVLLWVLILGGWVQIRPELFPLTIFLTCVNAFYAAPFIFSFNRFLHLRRMNIVGETILAACVESGGIDEAEARQMLDSLKRRTGIDSDQRILSWAKEYLNQRSVDTLATGRSPLGVALLRDTPGAPDARCYAAALDALRATSSRSGFRIDRPRARGLAGILFWAIPFLLFQLLPFYRGLVMWLFSSDRSWTKTARTRKLH